MISKTVLGRQLERDVADVGIRIRVPSQQHQLITIMISKPGKDHTTV